MICYVEAKNIKEAVKLVLEENINKHYGKFNHKVKKGHKIYRIKLVPLVQCADGFITQDRYIR